MDWLFFPNRVEIRVTDEQKHTLPVDARCNWQHSHGIALKGVECLSADGKPVEGFNDIWLCMKEAECEITGVYYCDTSGPMT